MLNAHCRNWGMARNIQNIENEICILQDRKYGEKHSKTWKVRNAHCRTWSMERKLKIMGNEKHEVGPATQIRNTQKCGKREMPTVVPGIWREIFKTW